MTTTPPAAPAIEVEAGPVIDLASHDFDAFVLEWGPHLGRFAFLLIGDHQLAEDLVQTALAKVVRHWGPGRRAGRPGAVRAHGRPEHGDRLAPAALAGRAPDRAAPRRGAGRRHGRPRRPGAAAAGPARAAPPRQRATVVLRFYEDLGEAEVARLLGCSIGTVKSQTAKGLGKLRTILDDGTHGSHGAHGAR